MFVIFSICSRNIIKKKNLIYILLIKRATFDMKFDMIELVRLEYC